MATAYREYLKTGVLERSDDDVKPDIPLYIETFELETIEKIPIPVSTMVPLTP